MNKRQLGEQYETMAVQYLTKAGYRVLERNFRCRTGEIDIIAKDGEYLVFVEVKYRSGRTCGSPLEAVDHKKQQTIIRVAQYYMMKHGYATQTNCRFDVVAIQGTEVTLVQNAFGT